MNRYIIREGVSSHFGGSGRWWTVVEYVDDVCLGGDRHWLKRDLAEAALLLYESGEAAHPLPGTYFDEPR